MKHLPLFVILISSVFFTSCYSSKSSNGSAKNLTTCNNYMNRGSMLYNKGCYIKAMDCFFKAHECFSINDQSFETAMSLNNIGNVYKNINDLESAVMFYDEALEIYTEINKMENAVHVLSNKAAALIGSNRMDAAIKVLLAAEKTAKENKVTPFMLLRNRAVVLIKQKKFNEALKVLNSAKKKVTNSHRKTALLNYTFGILKQTTKDYKSALTFFKISLENNKKTASYKAIADDLYSIGSVYINLDKLIMAVSYFKRSIKVYALIQNRKMVQEVLEKLNKAAKSTKSDLTLTNEFIKQWISYDALSSFCR